MKSQPPPTKRVPLATYRDKRAPGVTNEPFGDETDAPSPHTVREPHLAADPGALPTGAFVVHLHDATRRHYDVRLEIGGVLMSFAVPKGPSLDPQEKVLAVKTEDHPIEYLEFEEVIPDGQYGAGPMIAWDRGLVTYVEGPAEDELATGKLHVELRGMKLRGRWAFVKLAKGETGKEWLLFKKQDEHASPGRSIVDELPRSVLSGLTIQELERREAIAEELAAAARGLPGSRKDAGLLERMLGRDTSPLPDLGGVDSTRIAARPRTPRAYDAELDGIRVLAVKDGDLVSLRTWNTDQIETIESFYPDVVRALRALAPSRVAFEGELVAFDPSGHPSLALLAQRVARVRKGDIHRALTQVPVVLVLTDVLALGDADLRKTPLESRRALLERAVPGSGFLRAASLLEGDEGAILTGSAALGIASVIAKPKGSPYGRTEAGWQRLSTGVVPRSRSIVDHRADDTRTALRHVVVSNRDKIYWPDPDGFTKGDLVDYYTSVAPILVPYLKDRPVILVRYPDGIHGKSFFQWNVPVGMPPWVRTMTLHEVEDFVAVPQASLVPSSRTPPSSASRAPGSQKTPKRVFLVDDVATLTYIANLGCIPLHVLASRAPDLTKADFLTLDFDVKQSELRHAVTLARTLRKLLDEIGLEGLPKTSGQTGLHVLVPLGPQQSFETARALADLLGRLLVDRHPDIATMDRVVNRRGARVYVDTGQTGTSRAIVAPYSVRAVAGATVSTPLDWDEVTPRLDPRSFTIRTVPPRIAERGDLLQGLLRARPDIPGAVGRLARLLQP